MHYETVYHARYYAKAGIPALLAKLYFRTGHMYWRFIWVVLYKWLHLIKIEPGERFSWWNNFKPLAELKRMWDRGVY